jgi:hypothetical protein
MTRGITEIFQRVQHTAGIENVWTGDAFDLRAGHPAADKPGVGIYATEEGIQRIVELKQRFWQPPEPD